jgi:opacity protein-like surface antigen
MNNITEEESYTLVPYNDARFNLSGLQLGAGVEWTFSRRLTLGLEGIYQRHYDTSVLLLAERWGIKLGITHTF